MHELPAVADLVGDPPLVDLEVRPRLEPVHRAFVMLDPEVVAARGDAVDRRGLLEEPHPLLEEEVLVEERADRTDVRHVAGELVVEGASREDVDLLHRAAAVDDELGGAGHLAGEAHAPRAHDAAVGVEKDVGADVLLRLLDLGLGEATLPAAVLVGVVLQMALAGLVADRTVHRVVDQQVLHDRLLVGDRLGAVGVHDHAVRRGLLAGGHELRNLLKLAGLGVLLPDLGEADAAARDHREAGVVAVVRDLELGVEGGLEDALAGAERHFLAVDGQGGHGVGWGPWVGAGRSGTRREAV